MTFVTSSGKVHLKTTCPALTLRHEGPERSLKGKEVRNRRHWFQEMETFGLFETLEEAIIGHQGTEASNFTSQVVGCPDPWKRQPDLHHKPERMVVDNNREGKVTDLLPYAALL